MSIVKGNFSKSPNKKEKSTMKTIMKKRIAVGTIPMLALTSLLVFGIALAGDNPNQAPKPTPSLAGITAYDLVAPPFGPLQLDSEGRVLVWEGPITGDIEGTIQWWIAMPTKGTGAASHYNDLCVILDEEGNTLLVVEESGSTTYRGGGNDPIWRTNGVVTDAGGGYEDWIGRQTHADGNADLTVLPPRGTGTFRVN